MKANKKISSKTLLIIILIVIITLLFLIPLEKLVGKQPILGAVVAKVFIKAQATNQTCNVSLVEGWNLISIPCASTNTSLAYVFSSVSGSYTSVHMYNTSEQLDYWKAYNPNLPTWVVQDLDQISEKKGYWVNVISQDYLIVNGTIGSHTTISLVEGWNLVGYPANSSASPANALSSISGSYSIIWAYNTTDSAYYYYNPSLGSGTLGKISPDVGYWINMTQGDTWWIS